MARKERKPMTMVREAPVIARRMVDNPLRTAAQLEHELRIAESGAPVREDSVVWSDEEGNRVAGKISAEVNLTAMIGGLARVSRKMTEAQILAAARYRGLFDRVQIGAARATDYSAVRVDVSGSSETLVLEMGEDARREYIRIVQELGLINSALLDRVVCQDVSIRDACRIIGEGQGGAAFERTKAKLLSLTDELVRLFGYSGKAPAATRMRRDGDVPTDFVPVRDDRNDG